MQVDLDLFYNDNRMAIFRMGLYVPARANPATCRRARNVRRRGMHVCRPSRRN
jgi:hypothetical protein